MPCQLLVCAVINSFNPGSTRAPQRGDFVAVHETSWVFSRAEMQQNIVITVNDATVDQMQPMLASWIQKPVFTRDSVDEQSDVLRITVRGEQADSSGLAGITNSEADNIVDKWGGARFSATSGRVTFDISVTNASQSRGFLGFDTSLVDFIEISYTNGIHTVEMDARRNEIDTESLQRAVNRRTTNSVRTEDFVTYEVDRDLIQDTLLDAFQNFLSRNVGMRRFSVTEALVANAEAGNRRLTRTTFQLSLQTRNLSNG